MKLAERLQLEQQYHESEDQARNDNSLIRAVYDSGLFDEAEAYQFEALGDIKESRVLDYGCGDGRSTVRLRSRGAQVTGFDISHARLALAQSRMSSDDGLFPTALTLCAAETLPFADGAFDVVFGKQILHHLDLALAIPEILRVLRPGGKAVFLEPLIHNPILECYRRLTPRLRSPTERALSMGDLHLVGSHFRHWRHKEFCLFAVLPVLMHAAGMRGALLANMRRWLQRADRRLADAVPFIGRFYWETVVVLER